MKTLRGKLTIIISVGVFIVLGICLFTINKMIYRNMEEEIKKEMNLIFTYASNNIKTSLSIGNEDILYNPLNETAKLFSCYIYFKGINTDNYAGKYIEKESLDNYKEKFLKEFDKETKATLSIDKKGEVFIGTMMSPIYIGGEFKGGFIIQKSYRDKFLSYAYLRNVLLITQSLLMIALIGTIYFIIKKQTRELEVLAYDIKAFGRGEKVLKREFQREDEIGILRAEFNIMEENILVLQNESKEFFAKATHELKTPLTAIKGYSDLLLDEDFEDEFVITAMERINEEANKMKKLTENLLTISKEEEKINIYKEKISLDTEIKNIIKSLEIMILDKGITIEKDIAIKEIECFKEDFRIIGNNLISNAVKYTNEEKVYIWIHKEEENILFKVKNKIEDKEIFKKDIFKAFIKGESKSLEISSSGLGLYICKRICERNNWNITYKINGGYIEFTLFILEEN